MIHRVGFVRVRAVEILMRPRRNADRPWSARIRILSLEVAVVVEYLNSLVPAIRHVHIALSVGRNRVRNIELAGIVPLGTPGLDEPSVLIELCDSRIAVAIGDENVPRAVPCDIRRLIKKVARRTRTGQRGRSAFTAATSSSADE